MMQQICNSNNADLCKQILASAATVYRPITLRELASLVELPEDMAYDLESIQEIVSLCGSFLTIREDTVYFVHQSAKDFLIAKASKEVFPSGREYIHRNTFSRSLQVLSRTLQRDIYRLDAVGYPTEQIEQLDLDSDPLLTSRYSCVYWVDHLCDSGPVSLASSADNMQDGGAISMFLKEKYLYWLEALGLCKSMSKGVVSMAKLEELMQGRADAALAELVQDASRFIMYHKGAVESSPLQAYMSALLFSPTCSLIRRLLGMKSQIGSRSSQL
ncbi:hypothetical protein K469DRAFT_27861 [Zopfia rhizophila CBS 207.26]|uniref:GPI inositol-deacylase winged helix domain-containing protein n=1 Tax=Zopfia rhizophila CBS 207.26 TaxID=1314779 RepID=A0A6A6EF19_9PEZI|nr:hypothetical protein K469DRAFT_27861 [Zopfia rhizophila CBS 207.26]